MFLYPSVKQFGVRITQRDSIKRHSEGYSSSFMLIIIVILFLVLQVISNQLATNWQTISHLGI